MKYEITSYSICIPLTDSQWCRLSHLDDSSRQAWPKCYDAFIKAMEEVGALSIEFNGHFGSNFFCRVEKETQAQIVADKLAWLLSRVNLPRKAKK